MKFLEVEVQFEEPDKNFRIFTNMPIEGDTDSFSSLVSNWQIRTDNHSKKSLIKYFMSKKESYPQIEKIYLFSTERELRKHFKYMLK